MIQIFKRWYEGKTEIQYFDELNDDNTGTYVWPLVYIEYRWTAQAARQLPNFFRRKWEFIIGTLISVCVSIFLSR